MTSPPPRRCWTTPPPTSTRSTCGGTVDDNNVFGEGRLNAYEAVFAAPRGGAGEVTGTVTEADGGEPIAGATVSTGSRTATTGTDGKYTLRLPTGDATLTVAAFGFHGQTATVTVPDGSAVTKNFALVGAQTVTVSGKVTDGSGHGWPLYAKIDVAGRPGGPIFTDPFTGRYSFTLPGNASYTVTTTARYAGYAAVTTDLVLEGAAKTVNIAVPVAESCQAAGYSATLGAPLLSESFDSTSTPAGWSLVNRTDKGGWAFNDPGNRGNLTGGAGNFAIIDSDKLGVGNTPGRRPAHPDARPVRGERADAEVQQRLAGGRQRQRGHRRLHRRRDDLDQRLAPDRQPAWPAGRRGPADRARRGGHRPGAVPLQRHLRLVVGGRQRPTGQPDLHPAPGRPGGRLHHRPEHRGRAQRGHGDQRRRSGGQGRLGGHAGRPEHRGRVLLALLQRDRHAPVHRHQVAVPGR